MTEFYAMTAFAELLHEDGLLVMGHGLGIEYICGKFLQLYSENDFRTPGRVMLCLNGMGHEVSIRESMLAHGARPDEMPKLINSDVPSTERVEMYTDGGCFFITSRILIVDLLDATLDPLKIAGLLIYNAHKISETSMESFVIRIYREHNRTGFIKALTEDSESLQSGFGKVERLLRTLYLKKLYLYPRFRKEVVESLESGTQPALSESNLQLTPHMKSIQAAVLVAMNTCLTELKRACPYLETTHLTLENGLFNSFDGLLRTQLDSEWHKLSPRTKQLVQDMSTLRKLIDYLIRYDSFSFYYLLLKLRMTSTEQKFPSLWLMTEAGHQIFIHAQQRVYRTIPLAAKKSGLQQCKVVEEMSSILELTTRLEPILECPPKWKELLTILTTLKAQPLIEKKRVVLIVRDELACSQLKDLLQYNSETVMENRFRWFVSQKCAEIRRQLLRDTKGHAIKKKSSHSTTGAATAAAADNDTNSTRDLFNDKNIENLLLQTDPLNNEYAGEVGGKQVFGPEYVNLPEEAKLLLLQEKILQMTPPSSFGSTDNSGKSRKKRTVSSSSTATAPAASAGEVGAGGAKKGRSVIGSFIRPQQHQQLHEEEEYNYKTNSYQPTAAAANHNDQDEVEDDHNDIDMRHSHLKGDFLFHTTATVGHDGGESEGDGGDSMILIITTHATLKTRSSSSYLPSLQPDVIILYDSDVTIIRQIEVYQAQVSAQQQLQVFLLQYEGSTEEHRFVGSLSREKKAFDALIEMKRTMVISLPDHPIDLQTAKHDDLQLTKIDSRKSSTSNSANTSLVHTSNKRKLVIDVREFRSILPSILYATQYWWLLPRTLNVGDFVLSSEICVERKGISDLFQSFASGRLYNQVENMLKYYKLPCLLIEFAHDKSFILTSPQEMAADIQVNAIQSKIVLLTQSFPMLKILWSRSPQQTADIFRHLIAGSHSGSAGKSGFNSSYGEVDVNKAVSVGSAANSAGKDDPDGHRHGHNESGQGHGLQGEEGQDQDETARLTAQKLLLSLPGINVHNYREVMHRVNNIAALSKMSEAELTGIIGAGNAKKLRAFFTQRVL